MLHRYLRHVPTRFVNGGDFHFFNGNWGLGRGNDKNSTVLYHNRRSRDVHERVRAFHVASTPALQCSTDHGSVSRFSRFHFLNWQKYFDQSDRPHHSFCYMTEPRYLGKDVARVRWPEGAPRTRLRSVQRAAGVIGRGGSSAFGGGARWRGRGGKPRVGKAAGVGRGDPN